LNVSGCVSLALPSAWLAKLGRDPKPAIALHPALVACAFELLGGVSMTAQPGSIRVHMAFFEDETRTARERACNLIKCESGRLCNFALTVIGIRDSLSFA
jgi:hypothetical protein